MQLSGRNCLVVGASGAIGAAVARMFLEEGARVAVTVHSRVLRPSAGPSVLRGCAGVYPMEICDRRRVGAVVRRAANALGALDAVVNCAGVLGPVGPIHKVPARRWTENVATNLVGSFNLIQAALPFMLEQGQGKIICFSGGGAAYGRPFFTAYGAAKAALVRLVESVAAEVRDCGVDINAIAPGPVRSRMWEELRRAGAAAGSRALEELSEMDREGGVSPRRAAALAVFLASQRSNGISGRLISCVHDDWLGLESRIDQLRHSDGGMLRRVPFE